MSGSPINCDYPTIQSRRRFFALRHWTGFARHRWTDPIRTPLGAGSASAAAKSRDTTRCRIFSGDPAAPGFCTQVRLTQFSTNPSLWALSRMIRVEVRVYWDQSGRQLDCTAALPTDFNLSRYGFVYLVSSVLENNSPF